MKIDNIFDSVIEFGRDLAEQRKDQKAILGDLVFAREYATVKISLGRQVGSSMAIARKASESDIIFTHSPHTAKIMEERLKFFNNFDIAEVRYNCHETPTSDQYDTVWIDGASYIDQETLYDIYAKFAPHTKHFVLVG